MASSALLLRQALVDNNTLSASGTNVILPADEYQTTELLNFDTRLID